MIRSVHWYKLIFQCFQLPVGSVDVCVCVCAGCLPCPWRWSRPECAGSCSQPRAEADTSSDWPSAARLCLSSSHTSCTHPESWRSATTLMQFLQCDIFRDYGCLFSGWIFTAASSCSRQDVQQNMAFACLTSCLFSPVVQSDGVNLQEWGVCGWGFILHLF